MARKTLAGRFANFFSRSAVRARNNLGIIPGDERDGVRQVRNKELELYDAYYEGTQYDKLPRWEEGQDRSGEYIPIRKRQPRIKFNFAKVLIDRMTSKLVGDNTFPDLKIEDDEDANDLLSLVLKTSKLRYFSIEGVRNMLLSGAGFMRFQLIDGAPMLETYHANYCYPVFKPNRKLESVRIQYVYEDGSDLDQNGNPKKKWYRLDLTEQADILFNNPEYQAEAAPTFTPVSTNAHGLGFVQGEWLRTAVDKHTPDGPSIIAEVLDFIDELNYNLSQSSQAIGYNQDPQLTIKNMDEDGIEALIKSSSKAWNLGREGEAKYVESTMEGVKAALEFRDKVRLAIQDVARVVLLDPEKVVGHAQSGKAMEVLHGPMIELINELRPMVEDAMIGLATKMMVTILVYAARGFETQIMIPPGYKPASMMIAAHWPQIFPQTMDDLLKKAQVAQTVTAANVISRETAMAWLAQDFGIENTEDELARIESQPSLDPFGTFTPGEDAGSGAQ